MRMIDSSADDEEELATPEGDMNLPGHESAEAISLEVGGYRALLAITRPLVIAKHTPLSSRLPIYRDQAISLETEDCRAESALRKGEILCPDLSEPRMAGDEGLAATTALPQTESNLRIRIYLGMS